MLHLINEDLFSFRFSEDRNGQASKLPHIMEVCSANELLRNKEPNSNDPNPVQIEKFSPITRRIMNVRSYDDQFLCHPMYVRVVRDTTAIPGKQDNAKPSISVDVNCLPDGEEDRANLYVIAFPFNGLLVPIPETIDYRIYKGTIVSSGRPFWYHGRKYRKTLYLVISPNFMRYRFTDTKITLKFEAMGIYTDKRDEDKQKTNHEIMTIEINPKTGEYTATTDHEIIDHPVSLEPLTSERLWKTWVPENRPAGNGNARNQQQRPRNNNGGNRNKNGNANRRPSQQQNRPQGAPSPKKEFVSAPPTKKAEPKVIVGVNKHGIRKETTVYPSGYTGKPQGKRKKNNDDPLGAMIESAGLISAHEYRSKGSFTPKRNRKK